MINEIVGQNKVDIARLDECLYRHQRTQKINLSKTSGHCEDKISLKLMICANIQQKYCDLPKK